MMQVITQTKKKLKHHHFPLLFPNGNVAISSIINVSRMCTEILLSSFFIVQFGTPANDQKIKLVKRPHPQKKNHEPKNRSKKAPPGSRVELKPLLPLE